MLAVSKLWHVGKHTGISFGAPHFPLAMSFVSKQSIREKSVALQIYLDLSLPLTAFIKCLLQDKWVLTDPFQLEWKHFTGA